MTNDRRNGNPFLSTPVIVAGTVLGLGLLAAIVLLSFNGRSETYIGGILTAIGTLGILMVGAIGKLHQNQQETEHQTETLVNQTETLKTIEHQTNGELDARIGNAVETAVERAVNPDEPR